MKRLLLPEWKYQELLEACPEPYHSMLKQAAKDGADSFALNAALHEADEPSVTRLRPVCSNCLMPDEDCRCDLRGSMYRSHTGREDWAS